MRQESFLIGGRYRVAERLGSGGMGIVYRVYDPLADTWVALKQIRHTVPVLTFTLKPDEENPSVALAREFRVLATLRHPNIIPVLDFGFGAVAKPYYTMTLLEKPRDLNVVARECDTVGKVRLLVETLQSLTYLHRRGILHRDLKPSNVLVDASGIVRVLDFGLSAEQELAQGFVGTLSYMSPEVMEKEEASPASDLYSVGIMAYEFFAGRHPFDVSRIHMLIRDTIHTVPNLEALQVPEALRNVVGRLLMKDPKDRYRDAQSAVQAFCDAVDLPLPKESIVIRESFLRSARFVGREREMDKLIPALSTAKQGKGSNWLIAGESGIGKSRLVGEVRIQALVQGFRVLHGQVDSLQKNLLHTLAEALSSLLPVITITDLEASILKPLIPHIDRLVGFPVTPAVDLEAEPNQQRLIQTITAIFARQEDPLLLILEDLQWVQASVAQLRPLYMLALEKPLVIMGTYRSDETPYLYGKFPLETHLLELQRLNRAEIETLAVSMLGDAGRRSQVVDFVEQQSEGNAFFMIDAIQSLMENVDRLEDIGHTTLPLKVLSRGLLESARARLQRLPLDYHPILRLAAVIGREIDFALLTYVDDEIDFDDWLALCGDASILDVADGKWRFAHDKIRDGLLLDIDERRLPELHRLAAEAIEAVYPDNLKYDMALIEHWRQAGNIEKEIHYLTRAGFRWVETTSDYERVLMLINRGLRYLPTGDKRRIRLLNVISGVYWRQGDMDTALSLVNDAYALAKQYEDANGLVDCLSQLAVLARFRRQFAEAEQYFKEALDIADKQAIEPSKLLNNLGILYRLQARYAEAEATLQRALSLSRKLGDLWMIAMRLGNLGLVASDQGQIPQAQQYIQESVDIFRQIGAEQNMAYSLNNLGDCAYQLQDYAQATQLYEQSLSIKSRLKDAQWSLAHTAVRLGFAYLQQAYLSRATKQFVFVIRQTYNTHYVPYTLEALLGLAQVDFLQESFVRAAQGVAVVQAHPAVNNDVKKRLASLPELRALEMTFGDETEMPSLDNLVGLFLSLDLD